MIYSGSNLLDYLKIINHLPKSKFIKHVEIHNNRPITLSKVRLLGPYYYEYKWKKSEKYNILICYRIKSYNKYITQYMG